MKLEPPIEYGQANEAMRKMNLTDWRSTFLFVVFMHCYMD